MKKETEVFVADLETVGAAISPSHPNHFSVNEKLEQMRKSGIKVTYTNETKTKLDKIIEKVEPLAKVLETYPTFLSGTGEVATIVACHTKHPLLMDYFTMKWRKWSQYRRHLEKQLNSKFD